MVLNTIVSFVGLCFVAQRFARVPVALSPLFATATITLCLYLAALSNSLFLVAQALFYIGLSFFAFSIICQYRHLPERLSQQIPLVVFSLILVAFYIHLVKCNFHLWDEFTFWGKISKYLYVYKQLPTVVSGLDFLDYPPGAAIWHYFIYTSLGGFKEGYSYFAQFFLILSNFIVVFTCKDQRKAGLILAILLLVLSLSIGFLHTLYVEPLLATSFAGVFLSYVFCNHRWKLFYVLPPLLLLVIVKAVGVLLAAIASAFFIIDTLLQTRVNSKQRSNKLSLILALIMLPLGVYLIHHSWSVHVRELHAHKTFAMQKITVSKMQKQFSSGRFCNHTGNP